MKAQAFQKKNGLWEIGMPTWRGYPYGSYMVKDFNTKAEADKWLADNPNGFSGGIPICSALKDWQEQHLYIN